MKFRRILVSILCLGCSQVMFDLSGATNDSRVSAAETHGTLGLIFDVRTFGAVGDGTHLDTPAIQAAVDACSKAGGGVVLVPPGKYLIGTLFLKSNTHLFDGHRRAVRDFRSDAICHRHRTLRIHGEFVHRQVPDSRREGRQCEGERPRDHRRARRRVSHRWSRWKGR